MLNVEITARWSRHLRLLCDRNTMQFWHLPSKPPLDLTFDYPLMARTNGWRLMRIVTQRRSASTTIPIEFVAIVTGPVVSSNHPVDS